MLFSGTKPEEITLKEVLDIYEKYCIRHGLRPEYHLTHVLLMICQLAEASLLLGKSKDVLTDKTADVIQSVCKFYQQLDIYVKDYTDKSRPMILKKEKEPFLYINLLADVILHLFIYISGNGWTEQFLEVIKNKSLNDDASNIGDICRFVSNRIGWKIEQELKKIEDEEKVDDESLY